MYENCAPLQTCLTAGEKDDLFAFVDVFADTAEVAVDQAPGTRQHTLHAMYIGFTLDPTTYVWT